MVDIQSNRQKEKEINSLQSSTKIITYNNIYKMHCPHC